MQRTAVQYIKRTSGFDMAPPAGNMMSSAPVQGSQDQLPGAPQQVPGLSQSMFTGGPAQGSLSVMPAQFMTQQATRHARRVYVGGLPPSANEQWNHHLFELQQEMKIDPPIKYVLYLDDRSKHWRIQAVLLSPDSFDSRKSLAEYWRGLRDD